MNEVLERRFAAIGARLSVAEPPWRGHPSIDVRHDGRAERFYIGFDGRGSEVGLEVVDVRPRDRHLLLLVRDGEQKSKFLCGHDERHWFVAAVPESAPGVTGVEAAKTALQPVEVQYLAGRVHRKKRHRRRNPGYVRQGEWFFVRAPELRVDEARVREDEPLSRGRGKAHVMERAYRQGGETVYVSLGYPHGLSQRRFDRLTAEERRGWSWQVMTRDAAVYARGAVRHPDHATIHLVGWHRVLMNTEQDARAMRHVVFLD